MEWKLMQWLHNRVEFVSCVPSTARCSSWPRQFGVWWIKQSRPSAQQQQQQRKKWSDIANMMGIICISYYLYIIFNFHWNALLIGSMERATSMSWKFITSALCAPMLVSILMECSNWQGWAKSQCDPRHIELTQIIIASPRLYAPDPINIFIFIPCWSLLFSFIERWHGETIKV